MRRRLLHATRKTEVGDHELTLVADEEVGGLHVAMKNEVLEIAHPKSGL